MLRKLFGKKRTAKKVVVLMYHRIAEPAFDPWDLCVSADNFEAQLRLLQKDYAVISMQQLMNFTNGADIPDRSVCISFDDAYLDNYEIALPVLGRYKIPACFFVPGYYIEQHLPFWWDELTDIIFSPATQNPENIAAWNSWRWPAPPPDLYCRQLITIWEKLRPLPYAEIRIELDQLKETIGYQSAAALGLMPMTSTQLANAGNTGLIELGVHTQTHPFLPGHEREIQKQEIAQNAAWLKQFPGAMTNIIAYPYGACNAETLEVAKELGFQLGFTTKAQTVQRGLPALELGRFQVKNWTALEFEAQLVNWFRNY